MSEERSMILRMLKDEKISLEEAEALLEVLDEEGKEPGFDHAAPASPASPTSPDSGEAGGASGPAGKDESPVRDGDDVPSGDKAAEETERDGASTRESDRAGASDERARGKKKSRTFSGFWDASGLKDTIRATMESVKETVRSAMESVPESLKDVHIDIDIDDLSELKKAFGRHEARRSFSKTAASDGIEEVSIACPWADIEVVGGADTLIDVTADVAVFGESDERARVSAEAVSLQLERHDSRLEVIVDPGDAHRRLRADIEVRVPKSLAAKVANKSGDISVKRVAAVHAASTSGNISLAAIGGEAKVAGKSGSIEAEDIAGALDAETYSGDIDCERIRGTARLTTKSGDIQGADFSGAVAFNSLSGDVQLENVAGSLEGSTISGDINVEIPDTNRRLELSSTTGDVEVDGEADPDGTLALRLSSISGDINVELDAR